MQGSVENSQPVVVLSVDMPLCIARRLNLFLFTGVRNAGAVRAALLARELDAAVFDASLVASPACIAAAGARALFAWERADATASSLHSELVFALHGGRNVGEALRVLGPRDVPSMDLLVALFAAALPGGGEGADLVAAADEARRVHLAGLVDGAVGDVGIYYGVEWIEAEGSGAAVYASPVTRPSQVNARGIEKVYKMSAEELALPPSPAQALEAAVLARIAICGLKGGEREKEGKNS